MVSLEFEKPSTWSIGKKLGLIAILLLIVGPFMPYLVSEYTYGDFEELNSVTYFDYDVWGLFMLLPLLSALLMVFLLYLKSKIYFEKDTTRVNIKPFILMIWGFWFFLTYVADAIRIGQESTYFTLYAGYGLWMIALGFFLCAVVGFLEWRYPAVTGPGVPKVALPRKKEPKAVAEVASEPTPQVAASVEVKKPIPVVKVEEEVPKAGPVVEPEPIPVTAPAKAKKIEAVSREPSTEEEKTLLRWARHIAEDGKTFEQCMKCEKYVFLKAKDTGDTIIFNCPECGESFTLKK
ncbi:MAG: hypothetical protein V3U20_04900 [Thermoplasmata archaeon]